MTIKAELYATIANRIYNRIIAANAVENFLCSNLQSVLEVLCKNYEMRDHSFTNLNELTCSSLFLPYKFIDRAFMFRYKNLEKAYHLYRSMQCRAANFSSETAYNSALP